MQNDTATVTTDGSNTTVIDCSGDNNKKTTDCEKINKHTPHPMIKHIVCSGGGITGLTFYGILKTTHQNKVWELKNIKSFYGTSAGSIMAVMVALDYEWNILDDYIIRRPWQNVFKINLAAVFDIVNCKGVFSKKIFEDIFSPLFACKDIPMTVTMKEFYELTKIDIHIFTAELNAFKCVDISHTTHPDWKILDAIHASCSIPFLFAPLFDGEKCYADGGILLDYPLDICLKNGAALDEIFGINRMYRIKTRLSSDSSLFDYMSVLVNKSHMHFLYTPYNTIPNEICIEDEPLQIQGFYDTAASPEERIRLIKRGIELANDFVLHHDTILV